MQTAVESSRNIYFYLRQNVSRGLLALSISLCGFPAGIVGIIDTDLLLLFFTQEATYGAGWEWRE